MKGLILLVVAFLLLVAVAFASDVVVSDKLKELQTEYTVKSEHREMLQNRIRADSLELVNTEKRLKDMETEAAALQAKTPAQKVNAK